MKVTKTIDVSSMTDAEISAILDFINRSGKESRLLSNTREMVARIIAELEKKAASPGLDGLALWEIANGIRHHAKMIGLL